MPAHLLSPLSLLRHRHRLSRVALRATTLVWAGAWTAFVVAALPGEPWRGWVIGAMFCIAVWLLTGLAWWKPRLGGLAMLGAGVWAWGFFHSRAAMLGLVTPSIALGLGFVLLSTSAAWRARRQAAAAGRTVRTDNKEGATTPTSPNVESGD